MRTPTAEQLAIIGHKDGNALVLAGAGSGKTTTLVEYLFARAQETRPPASLVLMYNADNRPDFEARMKARGMTDCRNVRTYHSLARALISGCPHFDRHKWQLSTDGATRQTLIRDALKTIAMAMDDAGDHNAALARDRKAQEFLGSFIGLVAADMEDASVVAERVSVPASYQFIVQAFHEFERMRSSKGLLFFDDWLTTAVSLLQQHPEWAETVREFDVILVDEFQDINCAQYQLVKLLRRENTQIIAVGDVDQCIYEWRGSRPEFTKNFMADFEPCSLYRLSQSFRFGHSVALAAANLISHNTDRLPGITTSATGEDTELVIHETSLSAAAILQEIGAHHAATGSYSGIGVLVRRWSQAIAVELGLLIKKIPYVMPPDVGLSSSVEVKALISCLSIASGMLFALDTKRRTEILFNLLRYPHVYLPNRDLTQFAARLSGLQPAQWPAFTATLIASSSSRDGWRWRRVDERVQLLSEIARAGADTPASTIFELYIKNAEVEQWIRESSTGDGDEMEALERLTSLRQIVSALKQNCVATYDYFIRLMAMASSRDTASPGIELTTIFRAKGREFDLTILPGWVDGAFPAKPVGGAINVGVGMEQERRLAYVGLTRARRRAVIVSAPAPDVPAPMRAGRAGVTANCCFVREMGIADIEPAIAILSGSGLTPTPQLTDISRQYVVQYRNAGG